MGKIACEITSRQRHFYGIITLLKQKVIQRCLLSTRHKSFKSITLFILLIFLLQLVPGILYAEESHKGHTKCLITHASNAIHSSASAIRRDGRKLHFHELIVRLATDAFHKLPKDSISTEKCGYLIVPIDSRRRIRQAVSDHFHGSRYKTAYLVI
jgi:hypothetical protein